MIPDLSDLIGRPFDEQTWNCWTLCREVYRRRGIILPDYGWGNEDYQRRTAELAMESAEYVRLDAPEPWCIVAIGRGKWVIHAGIVLPDSSRFIHVRHATNTCIESIRSWKRMTQGYFRYEDNTNQKCLNRRR